MTARVTKLIPHSARLWCERCEQHYDFRDTPDRSCPECALPPETIREQLYDAKGEPLSGRIIPNPAHAEALANHPARDARGRPKQHESAAERQAAYRQRKAASSLKEDPTGG